MTAGNDIRFDLRVISSWIRPGARVIDLGCGRGDLLHFLKTHKGVAGTGIEHDEDLVACCIERGLSVLQGDINTEVLDYPEKAFDYVILSQTLQQVYEPSDLLWNLLTIGEKVIVSFPNFGYWKIRLELLLTGYAPKSDQLPFEWYDTPNIRIITINDFHRYARKAGFHILKEVAVHTDGRRQQGKVVRVMPNLLATNGIFLVGSQRGSG